MNEIVRGILLVLTMAAIMVVVAATMIATTALAARLVSTGPGSFLYLLCRKERFGSSRGAAHIYRRHYTTIGNLATKLSGS